ncbi:acyl-CoA N-acyltransferase [Mycena floridula]|nr:acyl-CoA N-acyltransferase [Mycena floridula]
MSNPQLQPFEINKNGEPFLQLKSHKNIILTPARLDDAPSLIELLNDPKICLWLSSPPFPYLEEHADWWLKKKLDEYNKMMQMLADAENEEILKILDDCPVNTIREVLEDGSEIMIGTVNLFRCCWMELAGPHGVNWEIKDKLEEENNARLAGDPEILWTVGYYLAPSHHGLGIMPDALDTLLHSWSIPRMAVKKMIGTVFTGNAGSVRVLEKVGFKLRETIENYSVVKSVMRGMHVLDWKVEGIDASI